MTLAEGVIEQAAAEATPRATRPRRRVPRTMRRQEVREANEPAYLAGATRQFRKKYRRWMRKPAHEDVRYIPPKGVTLDDAGDPVYELTDPQSEISESEARWRVVIAGRRFGKTHLACVLLLTAALERPGSLCWYVGPTYRQAKDIAWDTLKAMIPPWLLARKPNESTLTVTLVNGSKISLKGAEKPDRLRGRSLWFVVLDEFPMIVKKAWEEALRPSLSDTPGSRALFIGTPMGFNWGYDLHLQGFPGAENKEGQRTAFVDGGEWQSWTYTTAQGGIVTEAEIEAAKATLDPRSFRQEYHASFEALTGRVLFAFARAWHVEKLADDPGSKEEGPPVLVGIDFNVNPMTAVLAVEAVGKDGVKECRVFDALSIQTSSTEELAKVITDRFPRQVPDPARPGKTKPGRRLIAYPDPSGNARKSSAPAGQTDFTILRGAGFVVDAPSAAPLVKDRNNNTNAMLLDAKGRIRCKVHPRAAVLIKAAEGLTYKDGTNEPDKKSGHDHPVDALGYLLWTHPGFNLLQAYRTGSSTFSI